MLVSLVVRPKPKLSHSSAPSRQLRLENTGMCAPFTSTFWFMFDIHFWKKKMTSIFHHWNVEISKEGYDLVSPNHSSVVTEVPPCFLAAEPPQQKKHRRGIPRDIARWHCHDFHGYNHEQRWRYQHILALDLKRSTWGLAAPSNKRGHRMSIFEWCRNQPIPIVF